MKIPFLDLRRQYKQIKGEIDPEIQDVLDSQNFILGDKVAELEENIAKYCDAKHAIGVASGTDAILLSLRAHGISKKVTTSPFTFFATAGAIYNARCTPDFVDIDLETYNLDVTDLTDRFNRENTEAIIPVHLYGQSVEMDSLNELSEDQDLVIIEDAAQAIGAEYNGKKVGSMNTTCFSFFPSKNLGGYGDGGVITTNDDEIADRLRTLRVHGSKPKYYHHVVGYNSRLDALQAAVIAVKLKYLDEWTTKRQKNAEIYNKGLNEVNGIVTPKVDKGMKHVYNQYTIRVKNNLRDELKAFLTENGVGSAIYYPLSLHLQPCFSFLGHHQGDFPNSETASREVLSLPIFPELEKKEIEYVINLIAEFFEVN